MLTLEDLKNWLHRDLPQGDKVLLTLGTLDRPARVQEIKDRARDAGSTKLPQWNISAVLARTHGQAIFTKTGWELSNKGKERLRALGVSKISAAAAQVAVDLRAIGQKNDEETLAFVEQAIRCYEYELYRSAVVMSWLAAMHVLKMEAIKNHLAAFNAEAQRVDPKWRQAARRMTSGL